MLFVSCAGGEIKYSDRTVRIGHVVSVVCSIRGCYASNIAIRV